MSFYNVDIANNEEEFKDKFPDLREFFLSNLKDKLTDRDSCVNYIFHQVLGYMSPKGQCYEITYKKTDYGSYGRSTFTAYMECHIDKNGVTVIDNFDFG